MLAGLRDSVVDYETDVPAASEDWSPDVAAAADTLRKVAATTGRIERGGYAQTGRIRADSDVIWSAFVVFAPWAYDATVWDEVGNPLLSFADEAGSITATLDQTQYKSVLPVLGPARLVPEKEWSQLAKARRSH